VSGNGATVLLTSPLYEDVTALASRVLMINRGRLLYDGALEVSWPDRAHQADRARARRGDGNRVTAEALAAFGEVKTSASERGARGCG